MDGVTVITCTGGRPEAFRLCIEFVDSQMYGGGFQWIIVDDSGQKQDRPLVRFERSIIIRPPHRWQPGMNTLAANILAALPHIEYDRILFVEDDDRYPPDYVFRMASALEDAALVGGAPARYYHVGVRKYRHLGNTHHASLCETAMRREVLPTLKKICESPNSQFIDVRLWETWQGSKKLIPDSGVIGMKGMPGRPGIGIGHRPEIQRSEWYDDGNLATLRRWIGDDVKLYEPFLGKVAA